MNKDDIKTLIEAELNAIFISLIIDDEIVDTTYECLEKWVEGEELEQIDAGIVLSELESFIFNEVLEDYQDEPTKEEFLKNMRSVA